MIFISAKVSLLFLYPKGFPSWAIYCSRHHDWHLSKGTSPPYPSWAKPPFLSPHRLSNSSLQVSCLKPQQRYLHELSNSALLAPWLTSRLKKSVEQCSPYDCCLFKSRNTEAHFWTYFCHSQNMVCPLICLCTLIAYFAKYMCTRSDCFLRISLIRVHIVCFLD